ncbi:MAG: hypothetical protein ABJA57_01575 [Ginsengibacter sp.]
MQFVTSLFHFFAHHENKKEKINEKRSMLGRIRATRDEDAKRQTGAKLHPIEEK